MRRWLSDRLFLMATFVLVGLLLFLAILQFQWMNQIMDAQFERSKATISASGRALSGALMEEFFRLLFSLELVERPGESDQLALAYERWRDTARTPRMIREIYLVDPEESPSLMSGSIRRYDFDGRSVEEISWPEELRQALAEAPSRFGRRFGRGGFPGLPMVGRYLIVRMGPRFADRGRFRRSRPVSVLVLELDFEALRAELMPRLLQEFFPSHEELEIAVVDESRSVVFSAPEHLSSDFFQHLDLSIPLFDPRGQFEGTLGQAGTALRRVRRGPPQSMAPPRGGVATGRADRFGRGEVADTRAEPNLWLLHVRHRRGSLIAAVREVRNRNLAMSFGVLALLGSSVLMLLSSSKRLVALSDQKIEFVAGVSHELRTPLAVIRSAGENLSGGTVSEASRVQEYGSLIEREGRRLSELVDQVLEFAGIQSGARSFTRKSTQLVGLMESAIEDCAPLIRDSAMTVESHFGADETINVDAEALRRAVVNLIANATKYAADGEWLGIRAFVRESGTHRELVVSVSDRGAGVEASELAGLFEPFVRGRLARDHQTRGSGLGLTLVKRTMEGMGGRVEASSEPDKGSTFSLLLPLEPEPKSAFPEVL